MNLRTLTHTLNLTRRLNMNNRLLLSVATAMTLTGNITLAAPFGTFDPRSLAMGGTGVASGTGANASFYNPALLANELRVIVEFPVIGFQVADPDELVSDLEEFQNGSELNDLESAVRNFNLNPTRGNATGVTDNMITTSDKVATFSNRPLEGALFGGTTVAIPGESYGMAFYLAGQASGGGQLEYKDAQTVTDLTNELNSAFDLQEQWDTLTPQQRQDQLTALVTNSKYIQVVPDGSGQLTISLNEGAVKPQSEIQSRAVLATEFGFSYARNFEFQFGELAIGVTPKFQKITTIDYEADVDTDPNNVNIEDYMESSSAFNIDIGVAKRYGNGVTTGLVLKNLIPQSFRTVNVTGRGDIEQKPQLRFGAAHAKKWNPVLSSVLAMDLDITENSAGFDDKSRVLGLGAELDLYSTVQLRLGYRSDLSSDSYADAITAGLGISPFGVHMDLALSASPNLAQAYGGLQFGFRY